MDTHDLKLKEEVFAFCCRHFKLHSNDEIKFSDCKEQFPTIHPYKLEDVFGALVDENKVTKEPGRILRYKINGVEANKFNEIEQSEILKISDPMSNEGTDVILACKKRTNSDKNETNQLVFPVDKKAKKVVDKFSNDYDNSENHVPIPSNRMTSSVTNLIVAPVVKVKASVDSSLSGSNLDLLLKVLECAFEGSGGTVQLNDIKLRIMNADPSSTLLGSLSEGLAYLERQNKIMVEDQEIFQI